MPACNHIYIYCDLDSWGKQQIAFLSLQLRGLYAMLFAVRDFAVKIVNNC